LWWRRTGVPWRDLPEPFGPWETMYNRFARWAKSGKLKRLFEALKLDGDDEWSNVDSTINRVDQHAAGAIVGAERHAIRRSRGGLTTKVHLVVDALGLPMDFELTEGQTHDSKFDKDARRFYAIARGSALECAAIIDTFKVLGFINAEVYDKAQTLLDRVVAMLIVMIRD
jgi:transposase